MDRDGTKKMIAAMRGIWPNVFHSLTGAELSSMVDMWTDIFAEYSEEVCAVALRNYAKKERAFPTPAGIADEINLITGAAQTKAELWAILRKRAANCINETKKAFEALPPILQRYVGSPEGLRALGMMSEKDLDTIEKSHFMRTIGELQEKHAAQEELKRLESKGPESLAAILGDMKKLPEK